MYDSIVMAHNLFRWLVVGTGLTTTYFLFRHPLENLRNSNYFLWAFNQVLLYQIGFGLALYLGVSPIPKIALEQPELVRSDSVVRFWTILHGPAMLIALCVFHTGRALSRRATQITRIKILRITMILTLIIIICAIPWPFLEYGRPLVRLSF